MKDYFLLLIVGTLMTWSSAMTAQTVSTVGFEFDDTSTAYANQVRIHIIHEPLTLLSYKLQTSLQEEPIKLSSRSYTLLVTSEERIGMFQNEAVNDLPVLLSFERGEDYYFRIQRNPNTRFPIGIEVTEMTARAFQMSLFANDIRPEPEVYDYSSEEDL